MESNVIYKLVLFSNILLHLYEFDFGLNTYFFFVKSISVAYDHSIKISQYCMYYIFFYLELQK